MPCLSTPKVPFLSLNLVSLGLVLISQPVGLPLWARFVLAFVAKQTGTFAQERTGEKNYSDDSSTDRTQPTEIVPRLPVQQVEDDLANDLICEAIASPTVTVNISGSTFNDIHGDQNIHKYDNLSGNNSVRVDVFAGLRL